MWAESFDKFQISTLMKIYRFSFIFSSDFRLMILFASIWQFTFRHDHRYITRRLLFVINFLSRLLLKAYTLIYLQGLTNLLSRRDVASNQIKRLRLLKLNSFCSEIFWLVKNMTFMTAFYDIIFMFTERVCWDFSESKTILIVRPLDKWKHRLKTTAQKIWSHLCT